MSATASHEQLWRICPNIDDYWIWKVTQVECGVGAGDCSSDCKFFHELAGVRGQDWGVCFNSKSPRSGLLTFEHMACEFYKKR